MLFLFIGACMGMTKEGHASKWGKDNKTATFVMDSDTGLVLHRENANKPLAPASLTKMMTLLMMFDALDQGKRTLDSRIRISRHAASMIPSKLGLNPGASIKVKDAIYALSVKSANDIAVAVAEDLGGTESNFALMMTKKAHELGMNKTRFRNASGLHDARQVSTARDMANLGRILTTKYKKHYHYFSAKSFTYQGKTYRSHNKLMNTYAGMDGLKTGYIRQSGFNLVASAVRDDHRLIGVVFGGATSQSRNNKMKQLLDESFSKVGTMYIASNNVPTPQRKPVIESIEVASLNIIYPPATAQQRKSGDNNRRFRLNKSRWDMLDSDNENSVFNRMIGEGDYDAAAHSRIETGLIAVSTHMGEEIPAYVFGSGNIKPVKISTSPAGIGNQIKPQKKADNEWAIQVGAFTSRERTDRAIIQSLARLPANLRHQRSTIAPLKTEQGWIFRGRLYGYSKTTAEQACNILVDCIAISPTMYQ